MKTHLPHRLRAALMATLASVSLTSYAAAAGLEGWTAPPSGATKVTIDVKDDIYTYNPGAEAPPLDLTFKPTSDFNRETATNLYVLRNAHKGDIYATMQNSPFGYQYSNKNYYFVGLGGQKQLDGSLYIRSVGGDTSYSGLGAAYGIDWGGTVTGNLYLGMADQNTYSVAVWAAGNSTVGGTTKLEIASGTFNAAVAIGWYGTWSDTVKGIPTTLKGAAELRITGGTFKNNVVAGCYAGSGPATSTLQSGTNLVIKGGTFESTVIAGNSGAGSTAISSGTHTAITGGTFSSTVYGGSTGANSTINGGVDLSITGGEFKSGSKVYALGNAGTVNGAVSLTIGNDAKFSGNNVISAGTDGTATYTGSPSAGTPSQVTLKNLTGTSSLATDRTITVDGGAQKSWLVMENVDTTIKARLTNFSSMSVKEGSDLTLNSTNAGLGGASSVYIDSSSTLTLDSGESGSSWDWNLNGRTITGEGTLKLKGEGALSITDNTYLFTKVDMGSGTLSVDNTMQDKEIKAVSGSGTLAKTGAGKTTVKDASGFTGKIDAAGWGTLQLEKVDLTGAKAPQKVSVSNGATVNLINVNQGTDGASIELSIAGGTFGVYANDQDPAAGNVGNLTLAGGSKITIGTGTSANVLEANLVTLSGSVLDFTSGGQLTMGCTLDVQEGTIVLLNADDFDGLKNGTLDSVTLFNGIDNTSMDAANVIICRGAQEGAEQLTAQVDFQTDGQGNGTLSVKGVPEPATGTLSLLALAGLAARRRRKY